RALSAAATPLTSDRSRAASARAISSSRDTGRHGPELVRIHHPQKVPDAGPRGHEGEHRDDLAVAAQHRRGAAVDFGDRHLDTLPEPRLEGAYELGDRLAAGNRDARGAHHPA